MNHPTEPDAALEEYLKGDSRLSRRYREAFEELPPAHLDARILSEARRADAPLSAVPGPFSGHWMVPASVAVIVLAVSVVALLPEKAVHFPAVPEFKTERAVEGQKPADRAARTLPVERARETGQAAPEAARSDLKKSTAPSIGDPGVEWRSEPRGNETDDNPAGAAGAPVPLLQNAPGRRQAIGGQLSTGDEQPADPNTVQEEPLQQRKLKAESKRYRQSSAGDAPRPLLRHLESAPAAASAAETEEARAPAVPPDAALWLDRIARLVMNGELDAAAEELGAFRQNYPAVEISQAILSALEARK